jgi:hypothetical protein
MVAMSELIPRAGSPALISAKFAETPDGNDPARVRIDRAPRGAFDGPCHWTPRPDAEPSEGDPCILGFDNTGRSTILFWRPANG